jgi:RHS repeat-associated protein
VIIWCESFLCEERVSATGSAVRKRFPLGEERAGGVRLKSTDHIASVRESTDASGTLTTRYDYDAWGNQSVATGVGVPSEGYAGYEATTGGLWTTQFRQFDPSLGRWLSEDPAGHVDGLNLFSYVNSRPTILFDPFGLSSSGNYIECGPCTIRIDNDPHKGKHAHWWCRNGSKGCVKQDRSGCEGSGPPPGRVRECLENKRFFRNPLPALSCDQNCQQVLLMTGAFAASSLLTCAFRRPIWVPAPAFGR